MKRLEIMKILEAPHVKDACMILYAGARKKLARNGGDMTIPILTKSWRKPQQLRWVLSTLPGLWLAAAIVGFL